MQLWINVYNNNIFENLESILFSDDRQVARWFSKNLPWEIAENLSPQYEMQVNSASQIKRLLWPSAFKNIKWFYFWTEQCEYLLPTLPETQKAIELFKNFDKKYTTSSIKEFVFVTPYYWNPIIRQRLIQNLEYLNNFSSKINPKTKKVQIVVNDLGTLKLLEKYENLEAIIWRLLVKTIKNPLVDTFWLDENVHIPWEMMKNKTESEIKQIKKSIADNQRKWFWKSAISNEFFQNFLTQNNITRCWLDYLAGFPQMYEEDFPLDIYYPYALIFVWRLCDTSAIENIKRWYYAVDEPCPRTCRKFDMFIKNFDTVWYKIIQRWNAQYKTQVDLEFSQSVLEKYENRLVYAPMI